MFKFMQPKETVEVKEYRNCTRVAIKRGRFHEKVITTFKRRPPQSGAMFTVRPIS